MSALKTRVSRCIRGASFDAARLAERLDPEQNARMREIAIDDAFVEGEFDGLMEWF